MKKVVDCNGKVLQMKDKVRSTPRLFGAKDIRSGEVTEVFEDQDITVSLSDTLETTCAAELWEKVA